MEFVNAVYYAGIIEEQSLDIDVVMIVTDRCQKICVDQRRFKIENDVDLSLIKKSVKIYNDPYHLYKNFVNSIISGKSQISKEILINFFKANDDHVTMCKTTYAQSHNTENELNLSIFKIVNYLNRKNEAENDIFIKLSAFKEFFEKSSSKNNQINKISDNSINIIKNTKLEDKLTNAIINNIKTFNILCDDLNFVPYTCTNDAMENFINLHKNKVGHSIIKEIKNEFLTNNITNFII
jgi:hypothetical protein